MGSPALKCSPLREERVGFKHVESGPLVRSSYHAWEQVQAAELTR
jgi:lipoate synthase